MKVAGECPQLLNGVQPHPVQRERKKYLDGNDFESALSKAMVGQELGCLYSSVSVAPLSEFGSWCVTFDPFSLSIQV